MPEFNIIAEYIPSRTITAQFIPVNFDIPAKLVEKTIQANGVYNASEDNVDGYSSVTVVVPDRPLMVRELNVTPSTESQTINIISGIDGYGPVNVSAVENVLPENIKEGETILGIQGSVVELNGMAVNIAPSTSEQVIEPTSPKNAITRATVAPVTSAIDSNIQPNNIKSGITILGVSGNVTELDGEMVNITPTTSEQIITPTNPHNGITQATVSAVTSSIDSNIVSENIRSGVTILGVSGSMAEANETTLSVTPTTSAQSLTPSSPYTGFNEVSVSAVTSAIDPNIQPDNIIKGKSILGVDGTFYGLKKDIKIGNDNLKYLSYDTQSANIIDLSGIDGIDYGQLMRAYMGNNNLTAVNMSGIKRVLSYALYETFCECQNITSLDLSSIVDIDNDHACYEMCDRSSVSSVNLSALQSITGDYACAYMFRGCTRLNSLNLSSLTTVSSSRGMDFFCNGCSSLTSLNLDALIKIDGSYACSYSFARCTGLTTVSMKALTIVGGLQGCSYMFYVCPNISTADLSSLTSIVGSSGCSAMFMDCSSLSNMTFYSLSAITTSNAMGATFKNCTSLRTVSFPALYSESFGSRYTNQFTNLVDGVTGCTLHFPSNMQAKIAGLTGYPNFGGTDTIVLFDLPATLTLTGADSVTYTRNPKHDTGTALAWKAAVYGDAAFTPAYYTSGTADPQVGDTIYSDSACTQTVTTIGAIA